MLVSRPPNLGWRFAAPVERTWVVNLLRERGYRIVDHGRNPRVVLGVVVETCEFLIDL